MITGYNAVQAEADLRSDLSKEVAGLTKLILETAKSNIRYYPNVRNYLQANIEVLADQTIVGRVTADYWEAWLEQFGKGSLMAGPDKNPGLITYMNSELWNRLRSSGSRIVVGRARGNYKSIDGKIRRSEGSYAGVDLEELAARGDIEKSFGPTPPTFFLRIALQSNRNRILEGLMKVVEHFPYHKYFKMG